MAQKQILIVSLDENGTIQERILDNADELIAEFEQIGIDDCSTDLSLRGYPVVKGLVGPIPESKTTVRYESGKVFEQKTKEWAATKTKRRRRTRAAIEAEEAAKREMEAGSIPAPLGIVNVNLPAAGSSEMV